MLEQYCNSRGGAQVMASHILDSSARLRSSSRENLVSARVGAGSLTRMGAAGGSGGATSSVMGSSESVLLESASPAGLAFAALPRPLPRPRPRPRVAGASGFVVFSGSEGGPAEHEWRATLVVELHWAVIIARSKRWLPGADCDQCNSCWPEEGPHCEACALQNLTAGMEGLAKA